MVEYMPDGLPKGRYTTVSITTDLADKIELVVKAGEFQNRSDFCREAIRAHLRKYNGGAY